jgi:hypothetical protein
LNALVLTCSQKEYIKQWGITHGETLENWKQWGILLTELNYIQDHSETKIQKFKKMLNGDRSNKVDCQIGHELLHLFVLDLLGRSTPAAMIYHAKMDEEYKHIRVVSLTAKRLTVLCLLLLNAFFVYYAVLKGYVKGVTWQYNYLVACIMQMISEIVFFETMETFWMDVFIPSFAAKEVQGAFHQVLETVHRLCFVQEEYEQVESPKSADDVASNYLIFNTAEHLFVSYKVAKAFPQVLESTMILCYSNPFPGELAHKWKKTYEWTWKELMTTWLVQTFYGSTDAHLLLCHLLLAMLLC